MPKAEVVPALSDKEQVTIRTAQVRLLKAQQAIAQAQEAFSREQSDFGAKINALYASRKIKPEQYGLCDGPGPTPCEKASAGELTLQPVEKKK